jgi:hypothetical protein
VDTDLVAANIKSGVTIFGVTGTYDGPVACDLPWGGATPHGTSVTAYSTSTPTPPSTCSSVSETRTCNNGTLSGSYTNQSCNNGCTGTPWGNVAHGYSNTAYSTSSPAAACSTVGQTRTCSNGTMSGTYTITSCSNGCTGTPWGNVAHGYSNTAYSSTTPAGSCSSASQTRTCTNGTLSGSYTATSCTNGCTGTPWGNVAHGYSGTAYSSSSVPAGFTCPAGETRTCSNGVLSGSYSYASCSVAAFVSCSGNADWTSGSECSGPVFGYRAMTSGETDAACEIWCKDNYPYSNCARHYRASSCWAGDYCCICHAGNTFAGSDFDMYSSCIR